MTPKLEDRLARLEQAQAAESNRVTMPPGLYEHMLCDAVQHLSDYPNGETDTLSDGLARLLGYRDQIEADAATETDPETFRERVGTVWPRLVERYAPPGSCEERAYDNPLFKTWVGILGGVPPFKNYQHKTADAFYGPNGLLRLDYSATCVRAAFAFYGTTVEEVEAEHVDHRRPQ